MSLSLATLLCLMIAFFFAFSVGCDEVELGGRIGDRIDGGRRLVPLL